MNNMVVSIIVPVYNSDKYLNVCLSSLSCQSYGDIEVVCIDDGSQDRSGLICKEWATKDSRFHYYYQENLGVCSARNRGLQLAKGNYLCFVDSDDYIHADYVKKLVDSLSLSNTVVCNFTRNTQLFGNGDGYKCFDLKDFINSIVYERITHPGFTCFLYDNSIIRNNNLHFVEGCIRNEDYEFYMRYLSCCIGGVTIINFAGYYYRVNPSSVMETALTIKSLTSIEASRRINKVLCDRGLIDDNKIVLYNGILTYAYSIAKQHNSELYDYLHKHYDVLSAMKKMLLFPRFSKKMVALTYLLLGRRLFFEMLGILRFI